MLSMLDTDAICNIIYELAQSIINGTHKRLWMPGYFRSIDLMKAGNVQQKSLKMIGTLMKWHKLQDLPYDWEETITKEQAEVILKYNLNDVEITEKLLLLLEPQIKLRFDISELYNVYVHSESDSGIANRLLEKFYAEGTGLEKKEFKSLRTHRARISFRDVVYTRNIKFKTKVFEEFLENLLGHT